MGSNIFSQLDISHQLEICIHLNQSTFNTMILNFSWIVGFFISLQFSIFWNVFSGCSSALQALLLLPSSLCRWHFQSIIIIIIIIIIMTQMSIIIITIPHDGHHDYPANSHHDKNPPWWEFVGNEYGGNMPVTKSHHW